LFARTIARQSAFTQFAKMPAQHPQKELTSSQGATLIALGDNPEAAVVSIDKFKAV
jgi:hypothetical protein